MFYVRLLEEDSEWRRFIYRGVLHEKDHYTQGTRSLIFSHAEVWKIFGNPHDLMENGTIRRATDIELLTGTYQGDDRQDGSINRSEVTFV